MNQTPVPLRPMPPAAKIIGTSSIVTPAKAGVQNPFLLDSGFRRNDGKNVATEA